MNKEEWLSLKPGQIIYSLKGKSRRIESVNNGCVRLKSSQSQNGSYTIYASNDRLKFFLTPPKKDQVTVYVNDNAYHISDLYFFSLSYTKEGGWQLWHKDSLIGGQYDKIDYFGVEIGGKMICNKRKRSKE